MANRPVRCLGCRISKEVREGQVSTYSPQCSRSCQKHPLLSKLGGSLAEPPHSQTCLVLMTFLQTTIVTTHQWKLWLAITASAEASSVSMCSAFPFTTFTLSLPFQVLNFFSNSDLIPSWGSTARISYSSGRAARSEVNLPVPEPSSTILAFGFGVTSKFLRSAVTASSGYVYEFNQSIYHCICICGGGHGNHDCTLRNSLVCMCHTWQLQRSQLALEDWVGIEWTCLSDREI